MMREDIKDIKERLGKIEKTLQSHTVSQSTVSHLFKEYRDLLWAGALALLAIYFEWMK